MRIAILSHRIARYDAVSIDVRAQCSALQEPGYDVRLFAQSWQDIPDITHVKEVASYCKNQDDIIVLHYATAWPEILPLLRDFSGKIILRYHNITPPEYFKNYNESYVQACQGGLDCLAELLRSRSDMHYWFDSIFNHQSLLHLCEQEDIAPPDPLRSAVLPVLHQVLDFADIEADLYMLRALQLPVRDYILNVGRVVPNKNHILLIQSFALYRKFKNPSSCLLIAGAHDEWMKTYDAELLALIEQEDLNDAILFQEDLNAAQLKACYLNASILVSTSLHEGFGVPLIEAQALGLPVLALDRGAVGETLGEGGLLFEEANPQIFAAGMDRLISDQDLQIYLREKGFNNFHTRFKPDHLKRELLSQLEAVITGTNA